jgi:thiamine transport system substrate-binding protein
MMKLKMLLFIVAALSLAACAAPQEAVTLRLMTHDSFDIGTDTLAQFTEETGLTVEIFKAGDAGTLVNQAALAKGDPLADVLFGVDNTFLSRAIENDLFLPYESPRLADIPDNLEQDPQHRALPVDYGDVCLNYDKAWFAASDLQPPAGLDSLIDPAYVGLTAVQNPATSSPGLAFLLATIQAYGDPGYLTYWQRLVDNDVLVTDGWEEGYYGAFTAASDGDRPIVVSYASSPPAEVFYAEMELAEAPTAAVVSDGSCFRQIEFVGVLRGTEHEQEARQLVDFLLDVPFQEEVPLTMFVYPANETAVLPDVFTQFSVAPNNPATMAPDDIAANREGWIKAWTETVLR